MENRKLTIITKEQFINLYRLGDINIHKDFIVQADNIFNLLDLHQCEFDEDYLILEIICNKNIRNTFYNLKIIDVSKIFTLSQKAQNYFKPKYNQNIKFYIYPDKNLLEEIKQRREIEDIEKGIDIFIKKYDFINLNKIEEKIGVNFIKDSLVQFPKDNLNEKYISFYIDLLKYKRENYFPNTSVQYIYDLMIIIILNSRNENMISKYQQGQFPIEKSQAYQKLNLSNKDTLIENIQFIKNSGDEDIKKFINAMDGIENIIIGSIYLNLKDLLSGKKVTYQEQMENIIDSFRKDYQDELSIALYLTGLFFGYKNLYSDYYNFLDLNIFKEEEQKNEFVQLREENELLRNQLDEKSQSEKELKEEIEQKNKELLKQTQQQGHTSQAISTTDSENTNVETMTEKEVHTEENDISELAEKLDEKSNYKEKNQELSETQNERKFFDNETAQKEYFQFTDEEITKFNYSHLVSIAKERGVETPTSKKKYPHSPEGKIALYNAIKALPRD